MDNSLLSTLVAAVLVCLTGSVVSGKSLKAPPGLFKNLNDQIVGDAIIINGKQLFIDDYIIEELAGATKVLNQPVKHTKNPLFVPARETGQVTYASVIYDKAEGLFKMWYGLWLPKEPERQLLAYATSPDGINWRNPLTTLTTPSLPWKPLKGYTNIVFGGTPHFRCVGVFKDPHDTDPERRYKMLYTDKPDGTQKSVATRAAYSPDGILWKPYAGNPLIPSSDSQSCPYWDARRGRYVAHLRYGPPNCRIISRIESEDFVNWSPKVTILWPAPTNESRKVKMDRPFNTKHYGMRVMPYERLYVGLLSAYHGETIQKIPQDKLWMDKMDVQLTFSRNGLTWQRVGASGAIPWRKMDDNRDWKKAAREATFIPYGRHKKDWDWGQIYAHQLPIVVGDEIRIYYSGTAARHWGSYHGDPDPPPTAVGLATLRLDGFVSINAAAAGTMTTKKFVFIGDTLEVNANAAGGSIVVEALDADGKVIEEFSKAESQAINTDSVRHVLKWKGQKDCHLIQARPIRLRFYLKKAKLYSFTPRIRHKHYVQSYD